IRRTRRCLGGMDGAGMGVLRPRETDRPHGTLAGPFESFPLRQSRSPCPRGPLRLPLRPPRVPQLEYGQKGLLGHLDPPHLLHPLLSPLLLLEQLPLPGYVAAVALGGDVLAVRLDRLARDDPRADR